MRPHPIAWTAALAVLLAVTGCPTDPYGTPDDDATGDDDSTGDDDTTADDCGGDEICDPGEDVTCPGCAAVAVDGSGVHTCAVREDRSMWCWGGNMFEELGVGSLDFMELDPLPVQGVPEVVGLALGGQMVFGGVTCAVLVNGTASCWGYGLTNVPTAVPGLNGIKELACSDLHCCASTEGGTAMCWGDNEFGELGQGFFGGFSNTPLQVVDINDVADVSLGESGDDGVVGPVEGAHGCARLVDGSLWCWGAGGLGQLGDGLAAASASPVQVAGIGPAAHVSSGGESVGGDKGHTCAALQDGTAWCWGSGWAGQLGDGGTDPSTVPVQVDGIVDAVAVASGSIHACALHAGGTVSCWGHNYHGQLGDGSNFDSTVPVAVQGLTDVVERAAGCYHNCALLTDGSLRCWGLNDMGQLGTGNSTSSPLPVEPNSF